MAPRSACRRAAWHGTGRYARAASDPTGDPPMGDTSTLEAAIQDLPVPLGRDVFLRTLLRELSGSLQDVVGLDEAAGFISVVGQRIGDQLDTSYRAALGVERLSREQVAAVL